jgi:hypothetical protein
MERRREKEVIEVGARGVYIHEKADEEASRPL